MYKNICLTVQTVFFFLQNIPNWIEMTSNTLLKVKNLSPCGWQHSPWTIPSWAYSVHRLYSQYTQYPILTVKNLSPFGWLHRPCTMPSWACHVFIQLLWARFHTLTWKNHEIFIIPMFFWGQLEIHKGNVMVCLQTNFTSNFRVET